MKKTILLTTLSFLFLGLLAQEKERPPAPEFNFLRAGTAHDFTITDTEGNVLNLYDHLDAGYTVFVDLFFTTCSWCQTYAPIIEEIYQNTGAGEGDILFWGISDHAADTDPVIDQYKLDHNITNPCAGPDGNGPEAHNIIIEGQNFLGWPTYVVICPDRTMYFDPVYPPTVNGFNPYFEQCALVGTREMPVLSEKTSIRNVYPNPANREVTIEFDLERQQQVTLAVYNILGLEMLKSKGQFESGHNSVRLDVEDLPEGQYFLRMSADRNFVEARKLIVSR